MVLMVPSATVRNMVVPTTRRLCFVVCNEAIYSVRWLVDDVMERMWKEAAGICRKAARKATKTWPDARQHGAHSTQIHCWHCVVCVRYCVTVVKLHWKGVCMGVKLGASLQQHWML